MDQQLRESSRRDADGGWFAKSMKIYSGSMESDSIAVEKKEIEAICS
jgi:hypothetical protein